VRLRRLGLVFALRRQTPARLDPAVPIDETVGAIVDMVGQSLLGFERAYMKAVPVPYDVAACGEVRRLTLTCTGGRKIVQAAADRYKVAALERRSTEPQKSELRSLGLKCGQPGVEIGGVNLYGNRQALFDLGI
jgi:hypothetical protein